jgi:hypothetical protein
VRRRGLRPADLTSLFDVLFILVFVSLVNAAAHKKATAMAIEAATPPPAPPAPPPTTAILKEQALATLGERPTLILRVSKTGVLTGLDSAERSLSLDLPLLEHVPDPDIAVAYLGDRSAELRVCRQAALRLGAGDLSRYLVIIAPEAPLADLPVALVAGLRKDVERCLVDQHGMAVLVDPAKRRTP